MSFETAAAIDLDELVGLYESGESVLALAKRFSVDRNTITKRLRGAGITPRGMGEAQLLINQRRTPEERHRIVAAAHEAKRGRPNPVESRERGARSRQASGKWTTESERRLGEWLTDLGMPVEHQVPVSTYNCDLAAFPVAVEVLGGNWHSTGAHAIRYPSRCKEILDRGWSLVLVWDQTRCRLGVEAAHYVATFYEQTRRNPPLVSEYRVIRGDGEELSRGCGQLDDIALVPSQRLSYRRRTRNDAAR